MSNAFYIKVLRWHLLFFVSKLKKILRNLTWTNLEYDSSNKSMPHLLTSLKNIDSHFLLPNIYIFKKYIHLQQVMQSSFAKLGFASGNIFIFIWFISTS